MVSCISVTPIRDHGFSSNCCRCTQAINVYFCFNYLWRPDHQNQCPSRLWCRRTFIDKSFTRQSKLPLLPIPHSILVFNINGTPNVNGTITHKVIGDLIVAGDKRKSELLATSLGKKTAILGLPWLKSQKAIVDWAKGTLDLDPNWFTDNPKEDIFDTDILVQYIQRDPINSL